MSAALLREHGALRARECCCRRLALCQSFGEVLEESLRLVVIHWRQCGQDIGGPGSKQAARDGANTLAAEAFAARSVTTRQNHQRRVELELQDLAQSQQAVVAVAGCQHQRRARTVFVIHQRMARNMQHGSGRRSSAQRLLGSLHAEARHATQLLGNHSRFGFRSVQARQCVAHEVALQRGITLGQAIESKGAGLRCNWPRSRFAPRAQCWCQHQFVLLRQPTARARAGANKGGEWQMRPPASAHEHEPARSADLRGQRPKKSRTRSARPRFDRGIAAGKILGGLGQRQSARIQRSDRPERREACASAIQRDDTRVARPSEVDQNQRAFTWQCRWAHRFAAR